MLGFRKKPTDEGGETGQGETGGFLSRLRTRLSRTRSSLTEGLASAFGVRRKVDADLLEELETRLLLADVGVEVTDRIISGLQARVRRDEVSDFQALLAALHEDMVAILQPCERPLDIGQGDGPFVILVVGVNGAGKTTTIGKLASHWQADGRKVMLAAGDTFRAAAVEQLQRWGARSGIPVIAQQTGADSASVVYDALQAARARGADLLIADTAGRLHTQSNLMQELAKVKRVMAKLDPDAPHEVLLVLDASTGQNALAQAQQFHDAVGVTGLAITKLDGTAKGGVVFAIAARLGLPIRFIGVGESAEDLRPFDAAGFVSALLGDVEQGG